MPCVHMRPTPLPQSKFAARHTKVCLGPRPQRLSSRSLSRRSLLLVALTAILALYALPTRAQDPGTAPPNSTPNSTPPEAPDPQTIFPHPDSSRWWISGQFNTILQGHPGFFAKYSGAQSLNPHGEIRDSRVFTLYTGFALAH